MKRLLILFLLFPIILFSQQESSTADKYIEMYKSGKSSKKIIKKLKKEKNKIGQEKAIYISNKLIIKTKENEDNESLFAFLFAKVDLGETNIMILEDTIGIFMRENYPNKYKQLERHLNSSFIDYCADFYPDINIELAFIYRYLHRFDQRYKQLDILYREDKKVFDSLRKLSINQDSITEKMLGNIFENYGIPTIDLIGPEVNLVEIFFLHLSPEFVFKYLPDLQQAIQDKKIFISKEGFEFLVDKTLHKCCNKTIYGTSWSKYSPQVEGKEEIERIKKEIGIE